MQILWDLDITYMPFRFPSEDLHTVATFNLELSQLSESRCYKCGLPPNIELAFKRTVLSTTSFWVVPQQFSCAMVLQKPQHITGSKAATNQLCGGHSVFLVLLQTNWSESFNLIIQEGLPGEISERHPHATQQ